MGDSNIRVGDEYISGVVGEFTIAGVIMRRGCMLETCLQIELVAYKTFFIQGSYRVNS